MIHPIMRRCTTSPAAMFSALPAHRTQVRLRGLLKPLIIDIRLFVGLPTKEQCALPAGRLMAMRAGLVPANESFDVSLPAEASWCF